MPTHGGQMSICAAASMAASIAGAISPNTINNQWYENVQSVNDLELLDLAKKLYLLRRD
ncbi:hypothetical protein SAMN02745248_00505 [Hathewaya proteolytica DSM 3090]|uniref:Uncharacterized protein n=2 Tax=Hathewaya proteolytica TaxID=29365 RepID=A0A1M6KKN0_9CLOT|nr:hypothetical protein SAMN02745248_00505 [Hathewaya proteolytica DSM 3090]